MTKFTEMSHIYDPEVYVGVILELNGCKMLCSKLLKMKEIQGAIPTAVLKTHLYKFTWV